MKKIKKNDQVLVLTGRDKGRSGKVIKIVGGDYALVEGVNIISKNVRPNPNKNQQGGIVKKESRIHLSNVALMNDATKKADRVGFKILEAKTGEKAKKVRYFKSNDEQVDV